MASMLRAAAVVKLENIIKMLEGKSQLEARAGIEPAFEDLQSSTSPFCHRALTSKTKIYIAIYNHRSGRVNRQAVIYNAPA